LVRVIALREVLRRVFVTVMMYIQISDAVHLLYEPEPNFEKS